MEYQTKSLSCNFFSTVVLFYYSVLYNIDNGEWIWYNALCWVQRKQLIDDHINPIPSICYWVVADFRNHVEFRQSSVKNSDRKEREVELQKKPGSQNGRRKDKRDWILLLRQHRAQAQPVFSFLSQLSYRSIIYLKKGSKKSTIEIENIPGITPSYRPEQYNQATKTWRLIAHNTCCSYAVNTTTLIERKFFPHFNLISKEETICKISQYTHTVHWINRNRRE